MHALSDHASHAEQLVAIAPLPAVWARLGAEVTVVEFLDNIVPSMVSNSSTLPAKWKDSGSQVLAH